MNPDDQEIELKEQKNIFDKSETSKRTIKSGVSSSKNSGMSKSSYSYYSGGTKSYDPSNIDDKSIQGDNHQKTLKTINEMPADKENEKAHLEDKTNRLLKDDESGERGEKSGEVHEENEKDEKDDTKDASNLDFVKKESTSLLKEDEDEKKRLKKIDYRKLKLMCESINMPFIITACLIKEAVFMNIIAYLTIQGLFNIELWYVGMLYLMQYFMSMFIINYYVSFFILIWENEAKEKEEAEKDYGNSVKNNSFYLSFKPDVKEKFKALFKQNKIAMWFIYVFKMGAFFSILNLTQEFDLFMIFNILQITFDRYVASTLEISFEFFVKLSELENEVLFM